MPLARFALYESGVEIYIASTADDGDAWQATLVHIARESRCFVVAPSHFQRASSYPDDFPLRELLDGHDIVGRGGSAILAPDGSYLAGPVYDQEEILYAELDPARLLEERQRFDPAGHYHRPDILKLEVRGRTRSCGMSQGSCCASRPRAFEPRHVDDPTSARVAATPSRTQRASMPGTTWSPSSGIAIPVHSSQSATGASITIDSGAAATSSPPTRSWMRSHGSKCDPSARRQAM